MEKQTNDKKSNLRWLGQKFEELWKRMATKDQDVISDMLEKLCKQMRMPLLTRGFYPYLPMYTCTFTYNSYNLHITSIIFRFFCEL